MLRWLPLLLIVCAVALVFATGLPNAISVDGLARQYTDNQSLVRSRPVLVFAGGVLLYALATALALPGVWLLTFAAGLFLGWLLGTLLVVLGATIGATVLFLAARGALSGYFRRKAGPRLQAMAQGFREEGVSFMLFMRLVPLFPFALVNVVPAILGLPLRTYVWTTALGIVPGTVAYTFTGQGLRSVVETRAAACAADQPPCGTPFSASEFVRVELLIAFLILGVVSLLPILLRRRRQMRLRAPE